MCVCEALLLVARLLKLFFIAREPQDLLLKNKTMCTFDDDTGVLCTAGIRLLLRCIRIYSLSHPQKKYSRLEVFQVRTHFCQISNQTELFMLSSFLYIPHQPLHCVTVLLIDLRVQIRYGCVAPVVICLRPDTRTHTHTQAHIRNFCTRTYHFP